MSESSGPNQSRVQEAIEAFLDAMDAGQALDREEFLAKYAEVADELGAFLDAQDEVLLVARREAHNAPATPDGDVGRETDHPEIGARDQRATIDVRGPGSAREGELPTFAEYDILDEIARGGMGVVYKAKQTNLDRVVALKMILGGQFATPQHIARFRQEAEAAANLKHPGIVPIYEVGEHEGHHFFSMAYIEGPSLSDVLDVGLLPESEAAHIVECVARAMGYAHAEGVIHRDLKPSNILLSRLGDRSSEGSQNSVVLTPTTDDRERAGRYEPMVADFGLAKRMESGQDLTHTGQVMGTPSYMAPEQAKGDSALMGPATDVYALGAVLYESLVGRPPFQAATSMDTLMQVVENEPTPLRTLNPMIPKDLETICLKCLEKEPARRYGSADDLADELRRFLDSEPIRARAVGPVERAVKWVRRNRVVATLLLAVVLTLVVGSGLSTWFGIEATANATLANENAQKAKLNEDRAKLKAREAEIAEGVAKAKELEAKQNADREKAAKQKAIDETKRKEAALRMADQLLYDNQIVLSSREWENGDLYRAREALVRTRWDLRGWDYDYLHTVYSHEPAFIGHNEPVTALAFSPDEELIAGGSADGLVKVWEVWSQQELVTLQADAFAVNAVAFSPSGELLATGGLAGELKLWKPRSGERIRTIEGRKGTIYSLAFSPDGKSLAVGYSNGSVRVWNPSTGEELHAFGRNQLGRRFVVLAWSKDAKYLAGSDHLGTLALWDVATGKEEELRVTKVVPTSELRFDDEGQLLCWTGIAGGTYSLTNARTGRSKRRLIRERAELQRLVRTPDGRTVGALSKKGNVRLWGRDTVPNRQVNNIQIEGNLLVFSPSGTRFVTAGRHNTVRLWNVNSQGGCKVYPSGRSEHQGHPHSRFSIAFAKNKRSVEIFNVRDGNKVGTLSSGNSALSGLAWSKDGTRLAAGTADNSIVIWDLESREEIARLKGHTAVVQRLLFADHEHLVGIDADRKLIVWNPNTKKPIREFAVRDSRLLGSPGAEGKFVCSLPGDTNPGQAELALCDCRSETRKRLGLARKARNFALSGNGNWLVGRSVQGKIFAISTKTGKRQTIEVGQRVFVTKVSPIGATLAAATELGKIVFVDLDTGDITPALARSDDSIQQLTFSPDGLRLASAHQGGAVLIWDVTSRQPTILARDHMSTLGRAIRLEFVDGGRRLVRQLNSEVAVWSASDAPAARRVADFIDDVMAMAIRPDRKELAFLTIDGRVSIIDGRTGQPRRFLKGKLGWGEMIAFSPDNSRFIRADKGRVEIFETDNYELQGTLDNKGVVIYSVAFSPDGGTIYTGDRQGHIRAWNVATGQRLFELGLRVGIVRKIVLDKSGKRLAASYSLAQGSFGKYEDKAAIVWDVESKKALAKLSNKKIPTYDIALAPSGKFLALASGGFVVIWDIDAKKAVRQFRAHGGEVFALSFSAKTGRLATAGGDGAVRLWDVTKPRPKPAFVFKGNQHPVFGVVFDPKGEWLLTRCLDRTSYFFEPSGERMSVSPRKARRIETKIKK